ncbi:hypothetical protein CEB3_c14220 [Peptococcaceae bacterium CEB3]|nr:hypothetical protein CEB3_c14220 [Peptococcaceae bacterium CEB3]
MESKAGAGTEVSAGERAQQAPFQAAIEPLPDPEVTTLASLTPENILKRYCGARNRIYQWIFVVGWFSV